MALADREVEGRLTYASHRDLGPTRQVDGRAAGREQVQTPVAGQVAVRVQEPGGLVEHDGFPATRQEGREMGGVDMHDGTDGGAGHGRRGGRAGGARRQGRLGGHGPGVRGRGDEGFG